MPKKSAAGFVKTVTEHSMTITPYGIELRFILPREWPKVVETLEVSPGVKGAHGACLLRHKPNGTPVIFIHVSQKSFDLGDWIETLSHEVFHAMTFLSDAISMPINDATTEAFAYQFEFVLHEGLGFYSKRVRKAREAKA